jgi:hypothetical protein
VGADSIMKPITWAIRVTLRDGRFVLFRAGAGDVLGRGPIATFRTKELAEAAADALRLRVDAQDVAVFERSHGRQWSS